jgi:hypothetical protein
VEFKVKLTEWMGATIAISGLAMSVRTANAQSCKHTWGSGCVAENTWLENTWEINGSNFPPKYSSYSPYANGGSVGGGGGANATPAPPTIGDIALSIYNRIEIVCQKQNEPPLLWSARAQRECRADVTFGLNQELPFFSRSGVATNAAATMVCGSIVADKAPNGGKPC